MPTPPAMPQETTLYETMNVRITNARAVFDSTTYPIANITSVTMDKRAGSPGFGYAMVFCGVLILLYPLILLVDNMAGIGEILVGGGLGLFLVGFGVYIIKSVKTRYWVRLQTAGGEINVLSSFEEDYVAAVVEALNNAIIYRG